MKLPIHFFVVVQLFAFTEGYGESLEKAHPLKTQSKKLNPSTFQSTLQLISPSSFFQIKLNQTYEFNVRTESVLTMQINATFLNVTGQKEILLDDHVVRMENHIFRPGFALSAIYSEAHSLGLVQPGKHRFLIRGGLISVIHSVTFSAVPVNECWAQSEIFSQQLEALEKIDGGISRIREEITKPHNIPPKWDVLADQPSFLPRGMDTFLRGQEQIRGAVQGTMAHIVENGRTLGPIEERLPSAEIVDKRWQTLLKRQEGLRKSMEAQEMHLVENGHTLRRIEARMPSANSDNKILEKLHQIENRVISPTDTHTQILASARSSPRRDFEKNKKKSQTKKYNTSALWIPVLGGISGLTGLTLIGVDLALHNRDRNKNQDTDLER